MDTCKDCDNKEYNNGYCKPCYNHDLVQQSLNQLRWLLVLGEQTDNVYLNQRVKEIIETLNKIEFE